MCAVCKTDLTIEYDGEYVVVGYQQVPRVVEQIEGGFRCSNCEKPCCSTCGDGDWCEGCINHHGMGVWQ